MPIAAAEHNRAKRGAMSTDQPAPAENAQPWHNSTETAQPLPEPAEAPEPVDRVRSGLEQALSAERKKRQETEQRLSSLLAADEDRRKAEAAEQGKFQDLYTEAEAARLAAMERLTVLEQAESTRLTALQQQLASRIEKLPEQYRALIPENLPIDTLSQHLASVEKLISEPLAQVHTGTLKTSSPTSEPIPAEAIAEAAKYGYSDARRYFDKIYSPRMKRKTK